MSASAGSSRLRPPVTAASIDHDELWVPKTWTGVLDVLFDGRRVWSFAPTDSPTRDGARRVAWPETLRPYLDGRARVTLRDHLTGEVVAEHDVAFGSGEGSVRVADRNGRPLAVTKWGRMNHPFDAADRETVDTYLNQVEEALAVLRDDCRLPAFLSYGNLLGAVREGKLIGHDVDADLGYLSPHEHPAGVIRESFGVERAFRRRGWTVRRENGGFLALFVPQPGGRTRNIDVFTCFFVDGFFHQVHDVRAQLPRSAILPLDSVRLEGREFPAPADPPALLEAAYGSNWRTPDPAFSFTSPPTTVRRIRGWLGGLRDGRDHWNKVFGAGGQAGAHAEPSSFAEWVRQREERSTLIVDVGCGTGADALYFAEAGNDVLGLDYAEAGIRQAGAAVKRQPVPATFELCNLHDLRHVLAMGARLAHDSRSKTLYSRLLAESLDQQGRDHLWRLAEMALRGGGHLYLEFRAQPRPGKSPARGADGPRPLDPETVVAEIRSRGGSIEHRAEGRDFVPDAHEDLYVCRLVASWPCGPRSMSGAWEGRR